MATIDVVHAAAVLLAVDARPCTSPFRQREKTEKVAQAYETLPPSAFEVSLARLAIAPLMPGARDVREQRLALGAVPAEVVRPAEVDLARAPAQRDLDRGLELARDAVGADEVPARPARDHGELDVEAGDPVDDLVHRPVAADRHEQRRAAVRRLARELDQVAGPLGEQRVALQPERGRPVGELGPAPPGRAVLGRGVDQEDGVANGCR